MSGASAPATALCWLYSIEMQSPAGNPGDDMSRTYVQVVIVEIVVLAFLWWLGRYSA